MESFRYHGLDNILDHCSTGRINMHEPIEVMNQSQTMKTELTVLKHFVVLSKSENISLIHILSRLRCLLKEKLEKLIANNAFVKRYVENVIKEWKSDIAINDVLKDGLSECNYEKGDLFAYDKLVEELECSQRGGSKLEEIERVLKDRQAHHQQMTPEYSKQMKIKLSDLFSECQNCSTRVKKHSVEAQTTYKVMDPKHLQILIDLSFKPKSSYLEFSNQFREMSDTIETSDTIEVGETFAVFLSETHDIEIPDTIHTMFLNYLLTVNMIKKEMNYINNSLKQIIVYMNPKLNTLDTLVKSFTTIDNAVLDNAVLDNEGLDNEDLDNVGLNTVPEPMDGEGLSENIVITDTGALDKFGALDVMDSIKKQFTFF